MKKTLYTLLILLLVNTSVFSQSDMTVFPMQIIPQSNSMNPALIPTCRLHIGFPALSSIMLNVGHTGFNPHNVLSINSKDSVEFDMTAMLDQLAKNNYVNFSTSMEILSFGFKLKKKHYINFSLNEKAYMRVSYPKDMMDFIYQGNGALLGKEIQFAPQVNASYYHDLSFGYALEYNTKWTFGAHAHLLFGVANLNFKRSDISLTTADNMFDITAQSDVLINFNVPEEARDTLDNTKPDWAEFAKGTKNKGIALDLGALYKYNDKLTLGLSVTDLGFISWAGSPMNLVSRDPNGTFTYSGVDITEFLNSTDSANNAFLDNTLDSIYDIFRIDSTYNNYKTWLNSRVYASAFYQLTPKDRVTAIARTEFYNKSVHPAFQISYNRKFGKILNLTGSYSIANRSFSNLGFGMAITAGFFQVYVSTDNILAPFVWNKYQWDNGNGSLTLPRNMKNMNFHFGLNFVFGCKPPKDYVPIID